jgi:hypothetical protein
MSGVSIASSIQAAVEQTAQQIADDPDWGANSIWFILGSVTTCFFVNRLKNSGIL